MKSRLLPALCASLCLSVSAFAQTFPGTSDFSNSTNWLTPVTASGNGTLTITGGALGVLQYTASGTTSTNQAYTTWTLGTAPFTSDWSVKVDVHLAALTLTSGQWANLNLIASHTQQMPVNGTNGDQIDIAIDRNTGATPSGFETTMNAYLGTTNTPISPAYANSGTTDAALGITFDSTTKIISTYYDIDGPGAAGWTLQGAYNIGSGTYDWGMTGTDTFTFVLVGSSEQTLGITAGQAYFDNFGATAGVVPEPSTYAAILGACALGLVALRRRCRRES